MFGCSISGPGLFGPEVALGRWALSRAPEQQPPLFKWQGARGCHGIKGSGRPDEQTLRIGRSAEGALLCGPIRPPAVAAGVPVLADEGADGPMRHSAQPQPDTFPQWYTPAPGAFSYTVRPVLPAVGAKVGGAWAYICHAGAVVPTASGSCLWVVAPETETSTTRRGGRLSASTSYGKAFAVLLAARIAVARMALTGSDWFCCKVFGAADVAQRLRNDPNPLKAFKTARHPLEQAMQTQLDPTAGKFASVPDLLGTCLLASSSRMGSVTVENLGAITREHIDDTSPTLQDTRSTYTRRRIPPQLLQAGVAPCVSWAQVAWARTRRNLCPVTAVEKPPSRTTQLRPLWTASL